MTDSGSPRVSRRARSPIGVLLVDDHRLVAEVMERILGQEEDMVVLGTLGTVTELRQVTRPPDVILMDYHLTDGTGAEATRIAKARWPRARVIMLTAAAGDATIFETVQAGADGYLTKDRALRDVVAAVRATMAGEILLSSAVMTAIAKRLSGDPAALPPLPALTARELEVLRHLARGRSSGAIAVDLVLSPGTVRTHVQAIRRKLGANTKLQAVAIALERQLVEAPRA